MVHASTANIGYGKEGAEQGEAHRKGREVKERKGGFHDYSVRGQPQNAGYDEDVRYVRYGSGYVCR